MTLAQELLAVGTGISLAALAVSLVVHREAVLDMRAVRRSGVLNGRLVVARREIEAETARVISMMFLTIAVGLSWLASPDNYHPPPLRIIGLVSFILAQVVMAYDAVRALHSRRRILNGWGHHPGSHDDGGGHHHHAKDSPEGDNKS